MAFKAFDNARKKLADKKGTDSSATTRVISRNETSYTDTTVSRTSDSTAHLSDRARLTPAHPGSTGSFQNVSVSRTKPMRQNRVRKRRPNWLTRQVNRWVNRLVGAVADGTFADQEEQYESHRTTRDYVWNTIGLASWGVAFPILSIVVTQLVGTEQAGMFTMAFTVALLLMFMANYGVRTYQVSDLDEEYSFSDYQANRVLTCAIMMLVGFAYGSIRGYGAEMMTICTGVYIYKMVDGWADVYEGRLQQMDKLYLAGISQTIRSVTVLVTFSLILLITRNLSASCIVMGVVALITLFVVTIPLALFETPKSRRFSPIRVMTLLKQCFPLFVALFMYNLIENMPKFMMEGMLPYDNQLYYNAMWFPANALVIVVQVIYKPLLVRMAGIWSDMRTRKRFDILVIAMLAVIVLLTCGLAAIMWAIGAQVLGLLYGVDFQDYRGLIVVMITTGGVSAAIDFIYQVVTLLRKQGSVTKLYLITFGFSLFIPTLLVGFTGLPGAVLSYLIIMSFLLVLLVWEYLRIRIALANEPVDKDEEMLPERERQPRPVVRDTPLPTQRRSQRVASAASSNRGTAAPSANRGATAATRRLSDLPKISPRPQAYDDYAGVEIDEPSAREKARAAHAEKLRRAEAAAKRAERAARRTTDSERGGVRSQNAQNDERGESSLQDYDTSDEQIRGRYGRGE